MGERYGLPLCRVILAEGIGSAFLFGIFHPVLVLPGDRDTDEKVILHELIHLKQKDTIWGVLICILRCIHWCNPLLWYCGNQAGNDLEARCDYQVLSCLEGEERRDYGRILLLMANEKYARMPGTSSAANGGRNIRRRIESIVRFRKYPGGMALVSACIAFIMGLAVVCGAQGEVPSGDGIYAVASACTLRCSTIAGALDTYGKALLEGSPVYRAICSPDDLLSSVSVVTEGEENSGDFQWDPGIKGTPDKERGYSIYNLEETGEDRYRALVIIPLQETEAGPGQEGMEENPRYRTALCPVEVWKEKGAWVVMPEDEPEIVAAYETAPEWGNPAFPAYLYQETRGEFCVEIRCQQVFEVDNWIAGREKDSFFVSEVLFDTEPELDAAFDAVYASSSVSCIYLGNEADRAEIREIGIVAAPVYESGELPELPALTDSSAGIREGIIQNSQTFAPGESWGPAVDLGGSGSSMTYRDWEEDRRIVRFAADLYVNGSLDEGLDGLILDRTGADEMRGGEQG